MFRDGEHFFMVFWARFPRTLWSFILRYYLILGPCTYIIFNVSLSISVWLFKMSFSLVLGWRESLPLSVQILYSHSLARLKQILSWNSNGSILICLPLATQQMLARVCVSQLLLVSGHDTMKKCMGDNRFRRFYRALKSLLLCCSSFPGT
jgi:hypothetical protein